MPEKDSIEQKETAILVVVERLHSLHSDVNDLRESMKESMKEMSNAVTKLVQMEERQYHTASIMERYVKQAEKTEEKYEKLNDRVVELEKNTDILIWIKRGLFGLATLVGLMILKLIGVAP